MQVADAPQRFSWTGTELYKTLCHVFPTLRTKKQNVLDVEQLAKEIGMTKEGLYKWLRDGRILSKKGVERLIELANREPYSNHLAERGIAPPTKQDFARFLLS
jgi:hypothetical protein